MNKLISGQYNIGGFSVATIYVVPLSYNIIALQYLNYM